MRAILVTDEPAYTAALTDVPAADLPEGEVVVEVEHSTLNYKDSLAITGASPVIRRFPMVPGIDWVGTVRESVAPDVPVGSRVVLNGWGVGEVHWGGFAERAAARAAWVVPLPAAISPARSMAIGTAGYTAMLCVMALQDHGVRPDSGPVLVTGAAGGVGSVAISLLAGLGFEVTASTGRREESGYLRDLGAAQVIDRSELSEPGRPFGKERWAGAVDAVGSTTLANVLATTSYGGTVAACGLAQGPDLPATVLPFILRGVTLAGVDSVHCPRARRLEAWDRLASDLDLDALDAMTTHAGLADVLELAPRQLAGEVRGRTVIDLH